MPAAPIHATPHFVAFFVAHVVVYASSQDFVETALGQPYLHTKGAFLPAPFPIPGISPHPDHIQTHTISPHKPGSANHLQAAVRQQQKMTTMIYGLQVAVTDGWLSLMTTLAQREIHTCNTRYSSSSVRPAC
jgi:hypothetical protein